MSDDHDTTLILLHHQRFDQVSTGATEALKGFATHWMGLSVSDFPVTNPGIGWWQAPRPRTFLLSEASLAQSLVGLYLTLRSVGDERCGVLGTSPGRGAVRVVDGAMSDPLNGPADPFRTDHRNTQRIARIAPAESQDRAAD